MNILNIFVGFNFCLAKTVVHVQVEQVLQTTLVPGASLSPPVSSPPSTSRDHCTESQTTPVDPDDLHTQSCGVLEILDSDCLGPAGCQNLVHSVWMGHTNLDRAMNCFRITPELGQRLLDFLDHILGSSSGSDVHNIFGLPRTLDSGVLECCGGP